ncbi:hypothetical protein DB30_01969 [Enhygromyxa salina]|uniref:Uncharacterized protein n=1 Tax=Enhygromyxa salina TaxID=215803 RepID=A0A0C2DEI1_9BACT|nr:hypothetical protein [Enhygromyxa salina]KIG18082.1 hypothetical protein DB30_01969 [Enhygromyxa salina]
MSEREPRVAEVGRLFIIHHAEPPDLDEAKAEIALFKVFADQVGRAPMLMVPDKILPPMGQEVRAYYRDATTGDPGVEAMATVVGGLVGLGASIMSSIMTQIFQGQTGIPMRTIRELDEAAEWLCNVADVRAKPDEIVAAVSRLRALPS